MRSSYGKCINMFFCWHQYYLLCRYGHVPIFYLTCISLDIHLRNQQQNILSYFCSEAVDNQTLHEKHNIKYHLDLNQRHKENCTKIHAKCLLLNIIFFWTCFHEWNLTRCRWLPWILSTLSVELVIQDMNNCPYLTSIGICGWNSIELFLIIRYFCCRSKVCTVVSINCNVIIDGITLLLVFII
jgi:hypothetical protein